MASRAQSNARPLAIVTGASSGIGRELAVLAAGEGFDLIVAADRPLDDVINEVKSLGADVTAVHADLATFDGCDAVYRAVGDRPVAALLANAGHGLGRGFLEQDFTEICHVVDTNIVGTIYLIQKVARPMVVRGEGRILITGSIAGYMPGAFQAVYNGTKAFIDSFSSALRNELKGTGVTVTCLMPGVTDTQFFERADLMDTEVGQQEGKADPAKVAKIGFEAMLHGDSDVVAGFKNKLQVAMAGFTSNDVLAEKHRHMAKPRPARRSDRH